MVFGECVLGHAARLRPALSLRPVDPHSPSLWITAHRGVRSLRAAVRPRIPARMTRLAASRAGATGESPVSGELVSGLKCRLCGKHYPKEALNFCTEDFGPLEVTYDYEAVARSFTRKAIEARPRTMWRYHELLPVDGEPNRGPARRRHPLDPGRPSGQGAWDPRAVHQERRGESSVALVQGPRQWPSRSRRRSSSASRPWAAPRRATSLAASRPTPPRRV